MYFTEKQIERYSRHILLQEFGLEGLEKIRNGKVLVIGAGGLGAPALLYLAAAGVGTLGVIDNDTVDLTNLQRQIIHSTPDIGRPKALSAKEKINRLNPEVNVIAYHDFFSAGNASEIIKDYDFILDCTDNFSAKFLINDVCVSAQKPFSHGSVLRFEGQTLTYLPGNACYRCLFDAPPHEAELSSQVGVLGAVAGTLGTVQATEALKFLTGAGELLTNRLLSFDAKRMIFNTINVEKNKQCPVCGESSKILLPLGENFRYEF